MTAPSDDLLARASRCMLGSWGRAGPAATPTVFWWDGDGLWMTTSTANARAAGLDRDPTAVAYVAPLNDDEPGVVVRGRARVYRLSDPVGFVLHGPTLSAAMTTLALRHAGTLLGHAQAAAARIPPRLPRPRVVLRLVTDELRTVDPPDVGSGVAPALPTDVPADVRRALAGVRRVVLVHDDDGRLEATPAVWGAGYALTTPPTLTPRPGARAVAAVHMAPGSRPARDVGLAVHGVIGPDGRLSPQRATSWDGVDTQTVTVSAPAPGGVTLPD